MDCQQVSRLLKALAEPTRLRLVCLLARFDMICVCDLTEILQMPQYHVSRHLAVLRNLGIVTDRRDGARVNYQLTSEKELLGQLAELLGSAVACCPKATEDVKRANKVLKQRQK